jgi:hypothetical protein
MGCGCTGNYKGTLLGSLNIFYMNGLTGIIDELNKSGSSSKTGFGNIVNGLRQALCGGL